MTIRTILVPLPRPNNLAQLGSLNLGELGIQALVLGHVQSPLDNPQRKQRKEPLKHRLGEDWVDFLVRRQFCDFPL